MNGYELPLPTTVISGLPLLTHVDSVPISNADRKLINAKSKHQGKISEGKSKETKKPQATRVTKAANRSTCKNLKLGAFKKNPKIPERVSILEPKPNKIKNLVRDYCMPPGYKGGNS